MFRLHFLVNFVNTRKNFPDAQKLSGRQCRRADDVFRTLVIGCAEHWAFVMRLSTCRDIQGPCYIVYEVQCICDTPSPCYVVQCSKIICNVHIRRHINVRTNTLVTRWALTTCIAQCSVAENTLGCVALQWVAWSLIH